MVVMLIILVIAIIFMFVVPVANKKEDGIYHKENKIVHQDTDKPQKNEHFFSLKEAQGLKAEKEVANALNKITEFYHGYVFHSFIFKDEDGYSSEIDHILITRGGIFIIETKGQKGRIEGNENESKWISINQYDDRNFFINPLQQNQGHIHHLQKMLKQNAPKMYSMIVFPFADIRFISCPDVYSLDDAYKWIIERTKEGKYNDLFVKRMYQLFSSLEKEYGISRKEHLRNISIHHD